jgi:hypothetical protein
MQLTRLQSARCKISFKEHFIMFLAFMSAARIYGGKCYLSQIVNLGVYKIEDEFSCIFLKGIIFSCYTVLVVGITHIRGSFIITVECNVINCIVL